jgi:hypothetical protein
VNAGGELSPRVPFALSEHAWASVRVYDAAGRVRRVPVPGARHEIQAGPGNAREDGCYEARRVTAAEDPPTTT